MMGRIHLGTSGYVYRHWRGVFYPRELAAKHWLGCYASVFSTVELNNTFYRLPTPEAVDGWRERTPAGFVFACKGSRFLTHMKRLTETGRGLTTFFKRVERLGPKLGVVLWQLPPQMKTVDLGRLDNFLKHLPRDIPQAIEFRDAAWYREDVCDVLDERQVAFCEHDIVPAAPPRLTGGFRYVRFHGASSKYNGLYGAKALKPHAAELIAWSRRGKSAFVYFNNDLNGHAILDALAMSELLGRPLEAPLGLGAEQPRPHAR